MTSGLGPIRGSSTMLEMFAELAMQATMGKKARPLTTGEYRRVTCM